MAVAATAPEYSIDDAERSRGHLYSLLGRTLARAPDAGLLGMISALSGDGGELGGALAELAALARTTPLDSVRREYDALFIGVARGELVPYASFYLTGFLNEKPLARLRKDMSALGIVRAAGNPDPEDHIASLCEMMAGIIGGSFDCAAPDQNSSEAKALSRQHGFFERHIGPWAGRFFTDLERAEAAHFYRPVGSIGRIFMTIETEAFTLAT
jgi:TorA maturation chaperone TorD